MTFAKLDAGILMSSIWSESLATRVLWVSILAIKDEHGFVATSRMGLQRAANIPEQDFAISLLTLESPDPESRTPDHDGRRIERVDGGWIVLNHHKFRLHEDKKREAHRLYMRQVRDQHELTKTHKNSQKLTKTHKDSRALTGCSHSVSESVSESVSVSVSVSGEGEGECEGVAKKTTFFDDWYAFYPRKESRGSAEKAWGKIADKKTVSGLIITALEWQRVKSSWVQDAGKYIPLPATYINAKKWEDEKPVDTNKTKILSILSEAIHGF